MFRSLGECVTGLDTPAQGISVSPYSNLTYKNVLQVTNNHYRTCGRVRGDLGSKITGPHGAASLPGHPRVEGGE